MGNIELHKVLGTSALTEADKLAGKPSDRVRSYGCKRGQINPARQVRRQASDRSRDWFRCDDILAVERASFYKKRAVKC